MNYKALATIFLLVLPLFALPVIANQPIWNVEFRVRPGETKFMGPCKVSTNFPVDVYLWNDKSLSGVGVYAYDFYLWYDTVAVAGIELKGVALHIPWATGSYYIVKNETGTAFGYNFYHLAVTATGSCVDNPGLELGALSLFNASLVTLTFHIETEPFWPATMSTTFAIGDSLGWGANNLPTASTGCTVPITNLEIDHGTYLMEVGQPNIDVEATMAAPYPDEINVSAIGVTETVYIHLSNVTGAYGFGFRLSWEPDWKTTDAQHITILPAFAPPYEYLSITVDSDVGEIVFNLVKPSEKDTICSVDIPVIKIDFVSTLEPEEDKIPFEHFGFFTITYAYLMCKNEQSITFYPPDLYISPPLGNNYIPKSRADLNLDGLVDISDLIIVAQKYGLASPYADLVALGGLVDIFDIVYVAKRFGDP